MPFSSKVPYCVSKYAVSAEMFAPVDGGADPVILSVPVSPPPNCVSFTMPEPVNVAVCAYVYVVDGIVTVEPLEFTTAAQGPILTAAPLSPR